MTCNEMDQVSGGGSGILQVGEQLWKTLKKKTLKPPTCVLCCSTDVRLSEDKTRGYCDECMCDWLLEYANQSADVLP